MAKIVTGHTGSAHITADDWASFNAGLLSSSDVVLAFDMPEAKETTSGVVTLPKLEIIIQGVHCRTDGTEKVTIETGSQGLYRNDLIIGRYQKNASSGVESFAVDIVKGTASSSPSDPSVTQNDIRSGGTLREVPLYRIVLYGSTIQKIDPVISNIKNLRNLQKEVNAANDIAKAADSLAEVNSEDITKLDTRATNLENKLDFKGTLRAFSDNAKAALMSWVSSFNSSSGNPEVIGAGISLQDANGSEKSSLRIYSNGKMQFNYKDNSYNVPIIQRGSQSMTVEKANTAVKKEITFPNAYKSIPNVFVTIHASDPLKYGVSVGGVTSKSFTLYFNATSTTTATIEWCSIGRIDQ